MMARHPISQRFCARFSYSIALKIRAPLEVSYKAEAPGYPALTYFLVHRPSFTMGVEVVLLQPGNGERPQVGDTVTTHYVGTIASNGSTFGSSLVRGSPFITEIGVGKLIKGWDEGVLQLTRGSRAILKVSPDYAYGARGFPPLIPPDATLEFEVELLEIKPSSKASSENTDSD